LGGKKGTCPKRRQIRNLTLDRAQGWDSHGRRVREEKGLGGLRSGAIGCCALVGFASEGGVAIHPFGGTKFREGGKSKVMNQRRESQGEVKKQKGGKKLNKLSRAGHRSKAT